MRTLLVLGFLLTSHLALACHPECVRVCAAPVTPAICEPVCAGPACVIINATREWCATHKPDCRVECPADQCESDQCPACAVICNPPPEACNDGEILCEALTCSWQCVKPAPIHDVCEWQCEMPACEYARGSKMAGAFILLLLLLGSIL